MSTLKLNETSAVAALTLQVDNFFLSSSEMKEIIAAQIARMTNKRIVMEISGLVAEAFDNIVQCPYENTCNGACFVIHNVLEQLLLDVLPKDMMGDILHNWISPHFNSDDAAEKIDRRLLSTISSTAPTAVFIQRMVGYFMVHGRTVPKLEEQICALVPNRSAN